MYRQHVKCKKQKTQHNPLVLEVNEDSIGHIAREQFKKSEVCKKVSSDIST